MRMDRSHGIYRIKEDQRSQISNEIWNYKQERLGFNYRLNDLQCSLGLSQLKRLDNFLQRRHKIANTYNKELDSSRIQLPYQSPNIYSSFHLYPIRVSKKKGGISQKSLYYFLRENKILVNLHYIPIYRQPYFQKLGFKKGYCKLAEEHFKEVVSLPIFSSLSEEEQEYIIKKIKTFLSNN